MVSIIIPVKPGGRISALGRLRAVDYPCGSVEVLVAEGRQPSLQRNRAAAAATGEILYFLDDDSLVAPDFLARAVCHYEDPAVAVVGGPSLTPDSDGILQHSFGMVFASAFGGGGMRNRYRQTGTVRTTCDSELILCNLSMRRERFLAFGGFDERLYPNEENELMERIMRDGGRLVHDPGLAVYRSQRPTLGAFIRQMYGYGRGRGEQTVLSGVIKPVTFIPSLFIFYLLLLLLPHKAVYYAPLLCYVILNLAFAGYEGLKQRNSGSILLLPVIFPLFHLSYGLGMIRGLCSVVWKKAPPAGTEVTIRRMKKFGEAWKSDDEV